MLVAKIEHIAYYILRTKIIFLSNIYFQLIYPNIFSTRERLGKKLKVKREIKISK